MAPRKAQMAKYVITQPRDLKHSAFRTNHLRSLLNCLQDILIESLTKDPKPTWQAMEKVLEQGKAKSIGVSNWTIAGLEAMKSYAKVMPSVNQVECHPCMLLQFRCGGPDPGPVKQIHAKTRKQWREKGISLIIP